MLKWIFTVWFAIVAWTAAADPQPPTPEQYMHYDSQCGLCRKMSSLMEKFNADSSPHKRWLVTQTMAKEIKDLALVKTPPADVYTQIYSALNASVEVLDYDTYSDTLLSLLDVRTQFPAQFDYVLWHFPLGVQKRVVLRMGGKQRRFRPAASVPVAKELDN
jgi:hypothetical protein